MNKQTSVLVRANRFLRRKFWMLTNRRYQTEGFKFSKSWSYANGNANNGNQDDSNKNRLRSYFDSNKKGPGIWKWLHYFDIYERHLQKYQNKQVTIVEIGVYSGGSLNMWKEYFGDNCRVIGVDIEPNCKSYENEYTDIYIGDQESRSFWKTFKAEVGNVDIIIDDGGHTTPQQIVTLEEMLPFLNSGGVYICEDIHGVKNEFLPYLNGLTRGLNGINIKMTDSEKGTSVEANKFQSAIKSIHHYPYAVVIEKNKEKLTTLSAPKKGTEWQPFFD